MLEDDDGQQLQNWVRKGVAQPAHRCSRKYLPGSPLCALDPATGERWQKGSKADAQCTGDASTRGCKTHCCKPSTIINTYTKCNNKGNSYPPLGLDVGWEEAEQLTEERGWRPRLNKGELNKVNGPPADFVEKFLTHKKGAALMSAADKEKKLGIKYKLGWTTGGGAAQVRVGASPPPGVLQEAHKGNKDADLDPGFMTLDDDTGDIYAVPKTTGRYIGYLVAVDLDGTAKDEGLNAEDDQVVLKKWEFEVTEARNLGVVDTWDATAWDVNSQERTMLDYNYVQPDGNVTQVYQVDRAYEVPEPNISKADLFVDVKGNPESVRYTFSVCTNVVTRTTGAGGEEVANSTTTKCLPASADAGKFFVSQTGECSVKVAKAGSYVAKLEAQDSKASVLVREWSFLAKFEDTRDAANGPEGAGCANGSPVDTVKFDKAFTCDCGATKFTGANCQREEEDDADVVGGAIAAVLVIIIICLGVAYAFQRYRTYQIRNSPADFFSELQNLQDQGLVDPALLGEGKVPRELKRSWLALIDHLGEGQFGEVWKGLLSDGENVAIPEYMVAAKTVREAKSDLEKAGSAAAGEELLKEALLMAQVDSHPHLVSLVGVITRGHPKILVLSFCEHGELQGLLKKRAADGEAFDLTHKYRFCKEIADGMAHLAQLAFIHRDLAARNVLLGSGMVCKVADFGLSRRVQTDDNTGDYYRSTSGVLPVRWTAPEGLTNQKFSSASDVWSFGITCIEVFQDGAMPYNRIRSNPAVMSHVTSGKKHPRPDGMGAETYTKLLHCFEFDAKKRPNFTELKDFFGTIETTERDNPAKLRPKFVDDETGRARAESSYDLQYEGDKRGGGEDFGNAYNLTFDATDKPIVEDPAYADAAVDQTYNLTGDEAVVMDSNYNLTGDAEPDIPAADMYNLTGDAEPEIPAADMYNLGADEEPDIPAADMYNLGAGEGAFEAHVPAVPMPAPPPAPSQSQSQSQSQRHGQPNPYSNGATAATSIDNPYLQPGASLADNNPWASEVSSGGGVPMQVIQPVGPPAVNRGKKKPGKGGRARGSSGDGVGLLDDGGGGGFNATSI